MRYRPVKPYVMMSWDSGNPKSKMHPHVIVGKTGKGLVSVQVTHSPVVVGQSTKMVPDNIQTSYVVGKAYERPKSAYSSPFYPDDYHVSSRDRVLFENIVRKTKVPLK